MRAKKSKADQKQSILFNELTAQSDNLGPDVEENEAEIVLEDTLICALTGDAKPARPEEQTLQSLIEQLHREYRIDLADMARDLKVRCENEEGRSKTRPVSLAVYETRTSHEIANIIRVVLVAKPGAKADEKAIGFLEDVLANLSEDRPDVYGLWTNGRDMAFRLRRYSKRTGASEFIELTDFPAPDETLEDLNDADRRPLRVAAGDSLLRTFEHCHDYLYGNQNMRDDKAFWQLLYLIFAKILDEQGSKRRFFVGATERNTEEGQKRIATRIRALFEVVKKEYSDVFDGSERVELNDRALSYIAAQIARYDFLSTDTDAKGMAYEAITSNTLKQQRGQFFTPRNVIRMMVEMVAPEPGKLVLDPACGSGGFLVVALAHIRRQFLSNAGCRWPEQPVAKELKQVAPEVRRYAATSLFGIDVDADLRKAARMNMVMNGDGHGHIFSFNSLEYGIKKFQSAEMEALEKELNVNEGGAHGSFDYIFTNPPFGAKIPVEDAEILRQFELGHLWSRKGGTWVKGAIQKKVAPEILFIEACWKFLKPGKGVMAVVVPNGILGNPGEQMEFVRWWLLRHGELLASIDLPGEAFLPQVSVQASCVLIRRRASDEYRMVGEDGPIQRPVFMAIAEDCGHGRRGEIRYVRAPNGTEVVDDVEVTERWERGHEIHEITRMKKLKRLADDLPWIASQYRALIDEDRGR